MWIVGFGKEESYIRSDVGNVKCRRIESITAIKKT
jgi:hypothetical protein